MCHDMRGFNENSSVKTIQADMQPRIKAKGNHNTEGRPNDESITSETHKRRGEPNKQPILSISVRVCLCICVPLPREWLSCFTHTALPNWWIYWNASSEPENLYCSTRRGARERMREEEQKRTQPQVPESAGYRKILCFLFDFRLINHSPWAQEKYRISHFAWSTYCE